MDRKPDLNNNEDFIESEEYAPLSELDYRFFEYMQEGVIVSALIYKNSKVVNLVVRYANLIAYRQRKDLKDGLIDKSIKEIYDPETVAFELEKANEVVSTGRGIKYEAYRAQMDKHLSITAFSPSEDLYVTFSTDITGQKKASERLNAERQKLLNIIEFLPDATFVIDEHKRVIAWNKALEEMTDMPKEEILGKGNYEYSIPFYGVRRPILVDLIFLEEKEIESKYDYVRREGDTLFAEVFVNNLYGGKGAYVFVKASPLYDSTGKLVGSIETIRDINSQKNAEERINNERQKLLNIIEFLPDATFVIDEHKRVIAWNKALEEMTDMPKEEILGKGNYEYSIPFYGVRRPILVDLIFLEEKEIESKYDYVRREGDTLFAEVFVNNLYGGKGAYVFVKASPLYDSTGKLVGSIETIRDINSQKNAEERINNERQKLLNIIEFLPDATFVIDEHKRVIAWNKALEEMTDMPKEEILGKGNYEYSIPFYGVRRPILVDLIFLEEKEIESKYDYVRREGDTLFAEVFVNNLYGGKGAYVFVKASPLYDSTGKLVGSIETIRDITERKEFEAALHESEEKFRSTIEQSTDGVSIIAENGKIIEWNKGMEKITGHKRDEEIGKLVWESQYELVPEEEKNQELYDYIKGTIVEFLETGHAEWIKRALDRKIQRPDGEIRYTQSVTYRIKTEKGTIVGSITRDITEQKKAEEKLRYEQNLLNTVLNSIPVSVAVAEAPSGKLIRANEQFEKVWEQSFMPSENIEAYSTYKGFHPDGNPYKPEEWPLARSITAGEVVIDEEILLLFEDGTEKALSVSSTPIKDGNGKIILGVVIAADITRRKKTERLLKESEEKFAKVFYSNSAGIVITTINGEIIEVNNAYANITGYKREELLGKTVIDLNIISIDERDAVLKRLTNGDSIYNEEREIQTKTGEKRTVLFTVGFIEYGGEKKGIFNNL